eukprot:1342308-Amorphochlora_amoeboformis.AAC.1
METKGDAKASSEGATSGGVEEDIRKSLVKRHVFNRNTRKGIFPSIFVLREKVCVYKGTIRPGIGGRSGRGGGQYESTDSA